MAGELHAGMRQRSVELRKQLAGTEQQEDAAREMDHQDGSFNRWDFVMLATSIVILAFGIWWVTP